MFLLDCFQYLFFYRYMLAKGARLDLHSENGQGPRPIHWASRNGHVAVVDILLSVNSCRFRANRYSTALFKFIIVFLWNSECKSLNILGRRTRRRN